MTPHPGRDAAPGKGTPRRALDVDATMQIVADRDRLRRKLRVERCCGVGLFLLLVLMFGQAVWYRAKVDVIRENCQKSGVSFDALDTLRVHWAW